jgi:hypothetical protein
VSVLSTWMGAHYTLQNGGSVVTLVFGEGPSSGWVSSEFMYFSVQVQTWFRLGWRWLLSGMANVVEEVPVFGHGFVQERQGCRYARLIPLLCPTSSENSRQALGWSFPERREIFLSLKLKRNTPDEFDVDIKGRICSSGGFREGVEVCPPPHLFAQNLPYNASRTQD